MDHVVFKEKATLIISKELLAQISFLHNKVKEIEWSGLLFYKIINGDISNPKELVLRAERLHLMDIGTGAYTEFKPDASILDFYDKYPDCESMKWGLIHTHHNMNTFFSGTDIDELISNAGAHNYYLSLIVNFKEGGQYTAKVAMIADIETQTTYKLNHGIKIDGIDEKTPIKSTSKRLLSIDCNIQYEIDEFDTKRYDTIKESKKPVYTNTFSEGFGFDKFDKFKKKSFKKGENIYVGKTATEIDTFLTKLLSLNTRENRNIKSVLDDLEAAYKSNPEEFQSIYLDAVDKNIEEVYYHVFTNALEPEDHSKFFKQCIMYLDKYRMSGYSYYDALIDIFEMYIDICELDKEMNKIEAEEKKSKETKSKGFKFKQIKLWS